MKDLISLGDTRIINDAVDAKNTILTGSTSMKVHVGVARHWRRWGWDGVFDEDSSGGIGFRGGIRKYWRFGSISGQGHQRIN